MSSTSDIEQFNKDRDAALLSMDKETILDYYQKYGGDVQKMRQMDELAFWGGVHKARTALASLPMEERTKSKKWLIERDWSSWDDGNVPV